MSASLKEDKSSRSRQHARVKKVVAVFLTVDARPALACAFLRAGLVAHRTHGQRGGLIAVLSSRRKGVRPRLNFGTLLRFCRRQRYQYSVSSYLSALNPRT